MENYYKILGLKLGATLDEVEEKYSALLKEFDPKKQTDDLKEFFTSERQKVKDAYKEISTSLMNTESVEKVDDEINSVTSEIDSENEDLVASPIKELIDESQENKGNKFSISSEIELKLKRAYLIMFILGFPLAFAMLAAERGLQELIEVYFEVPLGALMFHFIGAILVLLCHMFLITRSSGFLSIRENLANYFIERKKYFIRILAFTPIVLFSLYGWGGMINYEKDFTYWHHEYEESNANYKLLKWSLSGDDYDSGCNKRNKLKIHNQSTRDLHINISYKKKNGNWSSWLLWEFPAGRYNGIRSDNEEHNGGTIYTTDYRYYIETLDYKPYLYSKNVPHITNTCNAKCINIY
jgi:hypothetical protein